MVIDNSELLRKYVTFYGSYTLAREGSLPRCRCDRCDREESWAPHKLELWMSPEYFKPGAHGNGPYLCVDCARHYGLVW